MYLDRIHTWCVNELHLLDVILTVHFPVLVVKANLNTIETYLKETDCEDVSWIHVIQDRIQWLALITEVMPNKDR